MKLSTFLVCLNRMKPVSVSSLIHPEAKDPEKPRVRGSHEHFQRGKGMFTQKNGETGKKRDVRTRRERMREQ